jgi:hypothetical protein
MEGNMKKFIVTTTINDVTKALKKFDSLEDWSLIVIGDKKTPDIKLKNGRFIPADEQNNLGFECVDLIPWNVIQRRNIGYLVAMKEGADVIATIDDDNIPYDSWGEGLKLGSTYIANMIKSELVCDILHEHSEATEKKIWHRGFPVQLLNLRRTRQLQKNQLAFVDVEAQLWDGDPDVDAVCRLSSGPFDLKFSDKSYLIDNNTFSPYNTQNTFFTRRVAPCMCLPYNIGRMDDIWASYMTQRVMRELNSNVLFSGPSVYQDRNEHDLSKDLEKELIGYRHTLSFLNRLNNIDVQSGSVLEMYEKIVAGIEDLEFIEDKMIKFQRAWINDMGKIL